MQMTQPTKTKRVYPALKIDRAKVRELAEKNVRPTDIAKQQGVAISTITRYLENIGMNRTRSERYAKERAMALTQSQLKKHAVEDMILEQWIAEPEKIKSQDVRLQKEIVYTLSGARNLDYQAERLERGQSTDIVDHRVISAKLSEVTGRLKALDVDFTISHQSGFPDSDNEEKLNT